MPLSPLDDEWLYPEFRGKRVYLDDLQDLVTALEAFGPVAITANHTNTGAVSKVSAISDIGGRDIDSVEVSVNPLDHPGWSQTASIKAEGFLPSASVLKSETALVDTVTHFINTLDPLKVPLRTRLRHPRRDFSTQVHLVTETRAQANARAREWSHDVKLALISASSGVVLGVLGDSVIRILT